MNTAIRLYRAAHPQSRAEDDTTVYGSTGCRRLRTCIYCRQVIATSSAKYMETKQSIEACRGHQCQIKTRYQRMGKWVERALATAIVMA